MSRDWLLFLDDLIESADRILRITEGVDFAEFQGNLSVHDAVLMNLLVIGEAVKNLPEQVRAQAPQINWRAIAGMRDLIAHQYFALDDHIVWDTVTNHVTPLLDAAFEIRKENEDTQ